MRSLRKVQLPVWLPVWLRLAVCVAVTAGGLDARTGLAIELVWLKALHWLQPNCQDWSADKVVWL